ncbi:MAG: CsiV family protein, partial [Steroidobacteraceae bacterium]
MKPLKLIAIVIGIACAATLTASAQTPVLQSYDVELLVFRTLNPHASPEEWGMEAAAAGQRLAIPEDEPSPFASSEPVPATTATFPALTPAKFKLTAIADTLRRSRNYQPLAHFGWTQPGYPRGDAKYLPINSLVPAGSGLVGQVALSRGRYLHLTIDLVYDAPSAAGEATQRFV